MNKLRVFVASDGFRGTILFLIALNAIAMGLEATPEADTRYGSVLDWVFLVSQIIFVAEMLARWVVAPRGEFFRDSWNRFDFTVVALSLTPAIGEFALVARVFRILRVMRIASVSDVLLGKVLKQDSGLRAVLLAVFMALLAGYVFALSGFHLFGDTLPQWNSLAHSTTTLIHAFTPSGFLNVLTSDLSLRAFHGVLYAALLCIGINLGVSLLRVPRSDMP